MKEEKKNFHSWLNPLYCFLSVNQYPVSLNEIYQIAEKKTDNEPLSKDDANYVLNQLRLDPVWQKVSWKNIQHIELPAMLLLKTGDVVVVEAFDKKNATISVLKDSKISQTKVSKQSLEKSFASQILTIVTTAQPIEDSNRIKVSEWISTKTLTYSISQIIVASLVINVFQLALPLYTMNVYDKVFSHQVVETLWVLFIGILIILVLDYIFRIMRSTILENISERVGEALMMKLLRKTTTIDRNKQEEIGAVSDVFYELNNFRIGFFSKTLVDLIELPFFFLFFAVIYGISPELAMIPLYAAILITIINLLHHFPLKNLGKVLYPLNKKKESFLIQLLAGRETLRLSNGFSRYISLWQAKIRHVLALSRSSQLWNSSMATTLPILVQLVSVLVIFTGAYQFFEGKITVGALVAVTILSGRAVLPVLNFANAVTRLVSSRHMIKSWKETLNKQTDYDLNDNITLKTNFRGELLIKDIHFKYDKSKSWALENINFTINQGEKIGIVGPSGAGKSTLMRVLTNLEKPQQGLIQLDGFSTSDIHPFELYRNINYMSQNPSFFSGTVYENIRLNSKSFEPKKLEEMVEFFGLNNLNMGESINGGLSYQVGEEGCTLSGGQKQLVALMRCLCTDSVLYILDEPTSGMDGQLEKLVIEYIAKELKDKSLIIVTHRPNLLVLVNNLLIVNQGKIIEKGPVELMSQKYFGSSLKGGKMLDVPLKQAQVT